MYCWHFVNRDAVIKVTLGYLGAGGFSVVLNLEVAYVDFLLGLDLFATVVCVG